jgi:hypothetical protein
MSQASMLHLRLAHAFTPSGARRMQRDDPPWYAFRKPKSA